MLSYFYIPALLYILSLFFIKKNVIFYIFFILILQVYLPFFIFKIIPAYGFATGTFIHISIVFTYITYLYTNIKFLNNRYVLIFLSTIILFFVYTYLNTIIQNRNPSIYLHYVRNLFFNILLFTFYISQHKKINVDLDKILKIFQYIIVLQVTIAISQYFFPEFTLMFNMAEYERFGQKMNRFDANIADQNLIIGTLFSMQGVSVFNMLGCFFIFLLGYYKLIILDYKHYILFLVCLISMILIGVRAPFIGLLLGIFLTMWINNKVKTIVYVSILICFLPLILYNLEPLITDALIGDARTDFEGQSWIRVLGLFAVFDSNYVETYSIIRSIDLYDQIISNPLFGSLPGIIDTNYSVTDAFITVFLVEYGLIGFIILLSPYLYILKYSKKYHTKKVFYIILTIFFITLSQSITNEGLWAYFTNIQFFTIVVILFEFNKRILFQSTNKVIILNDNNN